MNIQCRSIGANAYLCGETGEDDPKGHNHGSRYRDNSDILCPGDERTDKDTRDPRQAAANRAYQSDQSVMARSVGNVRLGRGVEFLAVRPVG